MLEKPKMYTFLKNRFKSSRPNDTILTELRIPSPSHKASLQSSEGLHGVLTTPAEPKIHDFARRRTQHVC